MDLKDLSPKAEPIVWANVIGLILAALADYGIEFSSNLNQLIVLVLSIALPNLVARFFVYAPDTVEDIKERAYDPMKPETWQGPPPPEPIKGAVPTMNAIQNMR